VSEQDDIELPDDAQVGSDEAAARSVKRGGLVLALVIGSSLLWYLLADRYTPYTSQARVQGYVVGVAPKVAGLVTEVFVSNDSEVGADQPLFQIDRAQYEIAVQKARSDLESARRQVDAGTAGVESARAGLLAAQANADRAQKDQARLARLRKEDPGTISMRRLENSQASLDQARAGVAGAEAEIQRAIEQKGGDVDADNAILKAARSAVEKAELDLDNTLVRASTAGIIADLQADVGLFAGTGSPVLTLISLTDVWINAEYTENNLGHLTVGSPVEILFDVLPGEVYQGKVRSIGLGVSPGKSHPPGTLPTIENSRDWLRQAQRFPVIVDFEPVQGGELKRHVRIGAQAEVIGYSEGSSLLNLLGKFYIRLMSWLSYAY